jgi:hypothetical protein
VADAESEKGRSLEMPSYGVFLEAEKARDNDYVAEIGCKNSRNNWSEPGRDRVRYWISTEVFHYQYCS